MTKYGDFQSFIRLVDSQETWVIHESNFKCKTSIFFFQHFNFIKSTEPEPDFLHDVSLEVCMKYYNCPKCKRTFLISDHFKHHIKAHVISDFRNIVFPEHKTYRNFNFDLFRRSEFINCPELKSNRRSIEWKWRRQDCQCAPKLMDWTGLNHQFDQTAKKFKK